MELVVGVQNTEEAAHALLDELGVESLGLGSASAGGGIFKRRLGGFLRNLIAANGGSRPPKLARPGGDQAGAAPVWKELAERRGRALANRQAAARVTNLPETSPAGTSPENRLTRVEALTGILQLALGETTKAPGGAITEI